MEVVVESKERYPNEDSIGKQITVRSNIGQLTVDKIDTPAILVKAAHIQFIGDGSRGGTRKTYERRRQSC